MFCRVFHVIFLCHERHNIRPLIKIHVECEAYLICRLCRFIIDLYRRVPENTAPQKIVEAGFCGLIKTLGNRVQKNNLDRMLDEI